MVPNYKISTDAGMPADTTVEVTVLCDKLDRAIIFNGFRDFTLRKVSTELNKLKKASLNGDNSAREQYARILREKKWVYNANMELRARGRQLSTMEAADVMFADAEARGISEDEAVEEFVRAFKARRTAVNGNMAVSV